jgi:polysaccharide export outer membrane protein
MRDPRGLFRAQRFEVYDGDLVYVANANLNELQKFVALIGSATQPPLTVRRTVNAF